MREDVLARFFNGKATSAELARDLNGSEERVSDIESVVNIEDMQEELVVTREMAVALCDAVLSEELAPSALATIGFALMASEKFMWDGEDVLGDIIADWSCPEVNYTLNVENVRKFRAWLTGREQYPEKPSVTADSMRIISVRRKKTLHRWPTPPSRS